MDQLLAHALVHSYERARPYHDVFDEVEVDRIRSFDQGTKNTGAVELVLLGPSDERRRALVDERSRVQAEYDAAAEDKKSSAERALMRIDRQLRGRVVMEHAAVINFHGFNNEADYGTIGKNMFLVLYSERMSWFWWPAAPIACERPVDQLDRSGPPMNFYMFGKLEQMVYDHLNARVLVDPARLADLSAAAASSPPAEFWETTFEWCPRAGCMKTGLEEFREDERKAMTLVVGPRQMRDEGDELAAEWTEFIRPKNIHTGEPLKSKPKPMEDICDAYLQGHRLLMDRIEERRLAAGRVQREVRRIERVAEQEHKAEARSVRLAEAQRKRELREEKKKEKEKKEEVALDKKRKRELDDDELPSLPTPPPSVIRPRKRLKKQDPIVEKTPLIDLVEVDD